MLCFCAAMAAVSPLSVFVAFFLNHFVSSTESVSRCFALSSPHGRVRPHSFASRHSLIPFSFRTTYMHYIFAAVSFFHWAVFIVEYFRYIYKYVQIHLIFFGIVRVYLVFRSLSLFFLPNFPYNFCFFVSVFVSCFIQTWYIHRRKHTHIFVW